MRGTPALPEVKDTSLTATPGAGKMRLHHSVCAPSVSCGTLCRSCRRKRLRDHLQTVPETTDFATRRYSSIHALCGWHGMHLVVEGLADHGAVLQDDIRVLDVPRGKPGERVLHPLLVVAH